MISYYLSIVNKQDPGTNPWVDFFKKQINDINLPRPDRGTI